ncbi:MULTISPECIES: hypothetical protein [unclassified Rhizobium]|uniref:hypothetical protein n=1 Tax=unclassified Rhizobium TaxID=2613769 RepID=UPI0007E996C4|nr:MULTISPECIES: hypothetical protein [unclassified Rhizobium]ANM11361.1 hypothetical protein AMK05_CH02994 [Rhizobium sp. N324]OYD04965.1 hypothetical protein AMK08_CH103012 [Rhizobium sp. N4311]
MSEVAQPKSTLPKVLLARMKARARAIQEASLEHIGLPTDSDEWGEMPEELTEPLDYPPDQELARLMDQLDFALHAYPISDGARRRFESGNWTFGSAFQAFQPRKIVRGFILPVRQVPISQPVSLRVFALIEIDDESYLDRHLPQGIHYHYCLADRRHTTTVICWDNRWRSDKAAREMYADYSTSFTRKVPRTCALDPSFGAMRSGNPFEQRARRT